MPVAAGTRVSSGFGPRGNSLHRGLDFATGEGGPIYAVEDGEVIEARPSGTPSSGFGFVIVIRHSINGELVDSVYGHMQPDGCFVKKGDRVKRGQHIADASDYGDASGPHLHMEVCPLGWYTPKGTWVDPAPWLGVS